MVGPTLFADDAGAVTAVDRERAARLLERMDRDGDDRVSRAEFRGSEPMFERFDVDGDGYLDATELAAMAAARQSGNAAPRRAADPGQRQTAPRAAIDSAPRLGEPAPDVSARCAKTGDPVSLAMPHRPLVLVFGSHT